MPETRIMRREKKNASLYYNSAVVCLETGNLTLEKCYTEGDKQFYLLRAMDGPNAIILILTEKQKEYLEKDTVKKRFKGKIHTTSRKSANIQREISDFFYINVENLRNSREDDISNVVKLKGFVIEIKEKLKIATIKIRVGEEVFPCIIEKERLVKHGVRAGEHVEIKGNLNTRDFYLDNEVYEASYTELHISYIKVIQ